MRDITKLHNKRHDKQKFENGTDVFALNNCADDFLNILGINSAWNKDFDLSPDMRKALFDMKISALELKAAYSMHS